MYLCEQIISFWF